jgi:hypothetical protein
VLHVGLETVADTERDALGRGQRIGGHQRHEAALADSRQTIEAFFAAQSWITPTRSIPAA